MSFLKTALAVTLAGLIAGLAISFLFTPRYVSTGVVAVRGDFTEASVSFSNEDIAAIIDDRRNALFEDERTRMPYAAIAIARNAIQISVDRPAKQSLALIRIQTRYRNQCGAKAGIRAKKRSAPGAHRVVEDPSCRSSGIHTPAHDAPCFIGPF
jgi:hypothetical protein